MIYDGRGKNEDNGDIDDDGDDNDNDDNEDDNFNVSTTTMMVSSQGLRYFLGENIGFWAQISRIRNNAIMTMMVMIIMMG